MCGIAGVYNYRNRENIKDSISSMTDAIRHRGPDAEGLYLNDSVALGHRRLSIIDTSTDGNQPFYNEDKSLVVVFNGEIYNYLELRNELKSSYSFRTESDTEVLLAAYTVWGYACVHKFIGMFAFAIWDSRSCSLLLVRDRLGIKPIYYVQSDGQIAFASEQRALIAGGFANPELNPDRLSEYLAYQTVHSPNSILKNVSMLPAGHMAILSNGGIEIVEYWNPIKSTQITQDTEEEIKTKIYSLLYSSVELRMRADVPFGAFLSGGIDSSAVVGLMSKIAPGRVDTFSVTFYEKEFDESQWSTEVAKIFGTRHHEMRVSANDFLNLIPEALDAMDHPGGDGPNTYVVSKLTREAGIKMALSGLGGDELFAGYDVFKRLKKLESNRWLNLAPQSVRSIAGSVLSGMAPSVATKKMKEILSLSEVDFAHVYPQSRRVFVEKDLRYLIYQASGSGNVVEEICRGIHASNLPLLSKVSMAEMNTYMQNVLLRDADQMSMARALEVRVPFLDHRLVEYVLSVPDHIKYPSSPKKLLVDSLKGLLPKDITERKKMGFTFPWKLWMKNELRSLCEDNLTFLDQSGHFIEGAIMHLWNRFLKDDPEITWSRVWHLVVLGYWMKKNNISK
jgi:asparagine synthase (glutamine-hydrolysing)